MAEHAVMDAISEKRLAAVCPLLATKIRQLADLLAEEGIAIRVVQGMRTWAEQDALYAQSRTAPGPRVTNCQGGHSYHNFGLAVDCVPDDVTKDGFQPDWNATHPVWARMESVGQNIGLDSGAFWRTFKDYPHFQLTGRFPEGSPTDEVRRIAKDKGMEAVWQSAFGAVPADHDGSLSGCDG